MTTVTKPQINFIDLKAQQNLVRDKITARINTVLDHGKYIMGPEIKELEERLCEFAGVKYCVSCASGTDALLMALMAYDVGPGDLIITTPFTFIATAEVISLLGATPVFVDIDPETFNIDPVKLRRAITNAMNNNGQKKARGIISVDLFGQPADYDEINKIATEFGLFVVEDGAQSFGAEYNGGKSCGLAGVGTTSFFPAKPLGCYGDGGAIFTNDEEVAKQLRSIRVHGKGEHKYDNVRIGVNGRMDTLQAAILLPKLDIFPEEIILRNRVAARYSERLKDQVKTPVVRSGCLSVWAQYSVLSDNREEFMDKLKSAGIPSVIYYPKPLHLQEAFAGCGYKMGDFPVTESCSEKIFSLPMHPYLDEETQNYICDALA